MVQMQPIPNNTIVYYASNEPKYTGSVGIITSGFISPKSEILTQKVKFTFGTFLHEFTHLHEVKQFTDKQKQSLEKLKLIHPHLFKDNEMRNFNLGDCVTHPEHQITGTVISERGANGHYKVLMDDGRDHVFHEDKITLKNNMTELEKAEKRIPMIVKFIQQFLATDLAQQLSPAQQAQLNKPGNYTTWPKLTEKLIKDDLERQAMEFINATKEKQATNIKNRELLLENLNTKYSANGTYSMFTIEMFSDEQVLAKYEQNHQLKLKLEQEQLDAEKIKNETKTEAVSESAKIPVAEAGVPTIAVGEQQAQSTPQTRNEETQAGIHNSPAETQTVIMFKLVVTGRTQSDHERLLPKFLEKINAAVDAAFSSSY